jgi:hypothetical protein
LPFSVSPLIFNCTQSWKNSYLHMSKFISINPISTYFYVTKFLSLDQIFLGFHFTTYIIFIGISKRELKFSKSTQGSKCALSSVFFSLTCCTIYLVDWVSKFYYIYLPILYILNIWNFCISITSQLSWEEFTNYSLYNHCNDFGLAPLFFVCM